MRDIIEMICYEYDCIGRILWKRLCDVTFIFFCAGLFWLLTEMSSTADRPKLQNSGAATMRSSAVKISLIFQILDKKINIQSPVFISPPFWELLALLCNWGIQMFVFMSALKSSYELQITEFLGWKIVSSRVFLLSFDYVSAWCLLHHALVVGIQS